MTPYVRRDLEPFDPPRFLLWGAGAHRVSLHAPMGVVSVVSTAGSVVPPDDGAMVGWLLAHGFPAPTEDDLAWLRSRE